MTDHTNYYYHYCNYCSAAEAQEVSVNTYYRPRIPRLPGDERLALKSLEIFRTYMYIQIYDQIRKKKCISID